MEIILVNGGIIAPGFGRYPGCYRLATELRKNGFSVQVIDFYHRLHFQDFYRLVESLIGTDTLFLGWSSTFSMRILGSRHNSNKKIPVSLQFAYKFPQLDIRPFYFSFEEIQQLQDLLRKNSVKFIVGGSEDREFFEDYDINYFFIGQADKSIVEFAKALKNKQTPRYRIEINKKNKIRKLIHQDDYYFHEFNQSIINWHQTDYILPGESLPLEVARGCIFKCTYCNYQLNGKTKNDYVKYEDVLYQELITNYEKYGTTYYMISDDLFNDTKEKIYMWHNLSSKLPFQLKWGSYLRLDMIHAWPETAQILLESGLQSTLFGIETLHDSAGKIVGKGLGKTRTLKTLDHVKKEWQDKVRISSGFIVGLPGETFEDNNNTFNWAMSSGHLDSFFFNPLQIFKNNNEFAVQTMSNSFEKYGYRIRPGGIFYELWDSEFCSYEQAGDFSWTLYQQQKRAGTWSNPSFSMSNRLYNIGLDTKKRSWMTDYKDLLNPETEKRELQYFQMLFSGAGIQPPEKLNKDTGFYE
jgi:hypothetical protein